MKLVICVYRDSFSSGGSFTIAHLTAKVMLRRSVDVYAMVAYGHAGPLHALLKDRCYLLQAKNRYDLRSWLNFRGIMRDIAPNVAHYVDGCAWMILAAHGLPIKRVMHQHYRADVQKGTVLQNLVTRIMYRSAAQIVCINDATAKSVEDKFDVPAVRLSVVHNACELGSARTLRPGTAQAALRSERVLGMAIRVVENKGVGDALRLLQMMPKRFSLSIAGDGPELGRFRTLAATLGLADRVQWLGLVSDIERFFVSIDYYLFMSHYEGFGLSVAEAMVRGIPVVGLLGDGEICEASYPLVTALNSVLIKRDTSYSTVRPANVNVLMNLRDEILRLDVDDAWRSSITTHATRWVRSRFSDDIYAKRILDVYRRVGSLK